MDRDYVKPGLRQAGTTSSVVAFVTLLGRLDGTPEIEAQIREHVSEQIGKLGDATPLADPAVMTELEQTFAAARAAEE